MKRFAFPLIALALAACAPNQPTQEPAPAADDARYSQYVDVTNNAGVHVDVKYMTRGGGPHYLGTLAPGRSETYLLPRNDVWVVATSADGQTHDRRSTRVRIRQYRAQRTG
jgi:hypothetical protein